MLLRGEPVVDGHAQNRRLLPPEGPGRYSRPVPGFLPCDSSYGGPGAPRTLGEGATNRSDFDGYSSGHAPSSVAVNDTLEGSGL